MPPQLLIECARGATLGRRRESPLVIIDPHFGALHLHHLDLRLPADVQRAKLLPQGPQLARERLNRRGQRVGLPSRVSDRSVVLLIGLSISLPRVFVLQIDDVRELWRILDRTFYLGRLLSRRKTRHDDRRQKNGRQKYSRRKNR